MAEQLGARKNGAFKAVGTAPSINKTPVGSSLVPLPYAMTQDLSNSVAVVPSVRFNRDPAYVLNQTVQPSSTGDAPGTAKGVKSGTVSGEVKPVEGSSTVRLTGKPVMRVNDPCTLNGGNCPGLYVAAPAPAAGAPADSGRSQPAGTPQTPAEQGFLDKAASALKDAAQSYKDKASQALHDFAGDAMDKGGTIAAAGGGTAAVGGGMVATGIGAAPGAVLVVAGGATSAVGGGVSAVGAVTESAATGLDAVADFALSGKLPNMTALATAYGQRMVMSKIDKLTSLIPGKKGSKGSKPDAGSKTADAKAADRKPESAKSAGGGGPGDGFKVNGSGGGPCIVGSYSAIKSKCPEGQEAHHIIADKFARTGNRSAGMAGKGRIPGMPSFGGGPAICLTGNAGIDGTEHHEAQKGDAAVVELGKLLDNGPANTAPVKDVVPVAMQSAINARPDCKAQIEQEVRKSYPDFENDDRSMRTTDRLPQGDAKAHLDAGNTADGGNRSSRSSRKK